MAGMPLLTGLEPLPASMALKLSKPRPSGRRTCADTWCEAGGYVRVSRSVGTARNACDFAFGSGASTTKLSNSISGIAFITGSFGKRSDGSYQGGFSSAPLSSLRHELPNLCSSQRNECTSIGPPLRDAFAGWGACRGDGNIGVVGPNAHSPALACYVRLNGSAHALFLKKVSGGPPGGKHCQADKTVISLYRRDHEERSPLSVVQPSLQQFSFDASPIETVQTASSSHRPLQRVRSRRRFLWSISRSRRVHLTI